MDGGLHIIYLYMFTLFMIVGKMLEIWIFSFLYEKLGFGSLLY